MLEVVMSGAAMWVAERIIVLAIIVVALAYAWPYLKTFVSGLLSKVSSAETSASVTSVIDNAVIVVDEYQARIALATAARLFEKHGNLPVASALRSYVVDAVAWSDTPTTGV
jgi:hypothetical protein